MPKTTKAPARAAGILLAALALAALPAEAAAQQPCGGSYTVRPGDNLTEIAERCALPPCVLAPVLGQLHSGQSVDEGVEQATGLPMLSIVPDRERLVFYGVSMEQLHRTVRTAMGGETAAGTRSGLPGVAMGAEGAPGS